jgi:16S rRNA C967 or C1407 C5-methylase (RsmB/RsmF family)
LENDLPAAKSAVLASVSERADELEVELDCVYTAAPEKTYNFAQYYYEDYEGLYGEEHEEEHEEEVEPEPVCFFSGDIEADRKLARSEFQDVAYPAWNEWKYQLDDYSY